MAKTDGKKTWMDVVQMDKMVVKAQVTARRGQRKSRTQSEERSF